MKKYVSYICLVVLMITLCTSFELTACADSDIKNQMLNPSSDIGSQISSYYEDKFDTIDRQKKVQRPKKSSYEQTIEAYFVDAPKGHSVYVYTKPDSTAKKQPVVYHGNAVHVYAEQDGWAFISYFNEGLEPCLGWVNTENLSSSPSCETISFGDGSDYELSQNVFLVEPDQEWSNFNFVDSKTKYVEIKISDIWKDNLVAMDIFYRVSSRNGVKDASGERNVYINDGSGWEYVGSFDVNKNLDSICVHIDFGRPRDIKAFAVIPSNSDHEECMVMQQVQWMYYPKEG